MYSGDHIAKQHVALRNNNRSTALARSVINLWPVCRKQMFFFLFSLGLLLHKGLAVYLTVSDLPVLQLFTIFI